MRLPIDLYQLITASSHYLYPNFVALSIYTFLYIFLNLLSPESNILIKIIIFPILIPHASIQEEIGKLQLQV